MQCWYALFNFHYSGVPAFFLGTSLATIEFVSMATCIDRIEEFNKKNSLAREKIHFFDNDYILTENMITNK